MQNINFGQVPTGIYSESHCRGMPNSKFATERGKILQCLRHLGQAINSKISKLELSLCGSKGACA